MPIDSKALAAAVSKAVRETSHPSGMDQEFAMLLTTLTTTVKFLSRHIDALEKRMDELPFKYMGSYVEGMEYSKGNFATHQGSLWHCNFDTKERPGTGSYSWTLAAKRGSDGRDVGR